MRHAGTPVVFFFLPRVVYSLNTSTPNGAWNWPDYDIFFRSDHMYLVHTGSLHYFTSVRLRMKCIVRGVFSGPTSVHTAHLSAPGYCVSRGSARWLTVNDAMDYLDAVKLEFRDQPEIYDEFLAIMGRFKTREILPPDVIVEVARLFRGRNSLVLRFNRFLPEGYKIGMNDIDRMEEEYQAKERAARLGTSQVSRS